ncbi:DNA polymerase I [Suttonella indologenes]|uniref:DNA polymerase I n=1 Tax=Suttonella indologenes TaxID=13276 RepID=A0A380MVZ4_9GAMM|nr:DNA polymerase I [Suttonella indologenes]SUO96739.1 DNA polymerase I [Suttonella indologenes]
MLDSNRLVVLVDGSSYLFRAFHGLPPLTNREGQPTGALHGVIKMLAKLYEDYQPVYFAVVFDAKGKTFRHEMFPAYKANRPPMPDDLRVQIEPLHELIRALGFPLIMESGVEADDVIGTLAARALAQNYQVLISSGDKDMAQLLSHADISLIDTMKNEATTAADVAQRFKVDALNANQVVDFLALVGDTADNIPGVDKVGPKTAAKWLKEYGSVENIIHNASKIGGKIGDNLRQGIEQLCLSYRLATIDCDVNIATDIADLALYSPNPTKIEQLCNQFDLNAIKQKYLNPIKEQSPAPSPMQATEQNYQIIDNMPDLQKLIDKFSRLPHFALDTETTALNYMQAQLVGISLAHQAGEAYYLPLRHQLTQNLPYQESLAALKPLLENPAVGKIGQHIKYDRHILAKEGIELAGNIDDTMLMSYCHNSTATRHNMDDLAHYYLNYQTTSFETLAGKGAKQLTFDQIDIERAAHYACEDADITLRLYEHFSRQLAQNDSLAALYQTIEAPLSAVLYRMEARGVKIDSKRLVQQSAEIEIQLKDLESRAYDLAGSEFNLGSPKQLQEILFERLGLPVVEKTPKGQPSTNESTLEILAQEHHAALPKIILEHRSLAKLKSTYTDKLPELIQAHTGRIHTSYHQAVTSTGRLSSSDPNLQNIPVRSAEGRRIRQAFIAESGYYLLAADYSQIELRIMAHLSGDEGLIQAFKEGKDIHAATAAEIFGGDPEHIDREHRRNAKAINFGLIYGMSAFGLARQLGISRQEAAGYIDTYFARYPKVRDYMDNARSAARQQGYAETLLGRRLYIPDINSKNQQRRNAAERLAINAPMQGSAADIIKLAMLAIDRELGDNPDCRLIMQVHDELVFEVRQEAAPQYSDIIRRHMENAHALSVPLIVDIGIGSNWDEAH